MSRGGSGSGIQPGAAERDELLHALSRDALVTLLAGQYPWGEWSDRYTPAQLRNLERDDGAGPAGPKSNVAITLFALESLRGIEHRVVDDYRRRAMQWFLSLIRDGWSQGWVQGVPEQQHSNVRDIHQQDDLRHTAEIASALLRFGREREPLSDLLDNIISWQMETGLWPPTPIQHAGPQLLASISAVEALAHALHGRFKMRLHDVLSRDKDDEARWKFGRGVSALQSNARAGHGLLGAGFLGNTQGSPFWTGTTLLRLVPAWGHSSDLDLLLTTIVNDGLHATMKDDGWSDAQSRDTDTPLERMRTTLRIAGGIGLGTTVRMPIPEDMQQLTERLVPAYLLGDRNTRQLDPMDIAFALIWLRSMHAKCFTNLDLNQIAHDAAVEMRKYKPIWLERFTVYKERLAEDVKNGFPGYRKREEEFADKLRQIQGLPD